MLVLVLFKDQVVKLSCAVQERKAMPQGKSCAASHIYMQTENRNILHTWSKTKLLLHIQHPEDAQLGFY